MKHHPECPVPIGICTCPLPPLRKRAPRELNDAKCAIRKMDHEQLAELADWIVKEQRHFGRLLARVSIDCRVHGRDCWSERCIEAEEDLAADQMR